MFVYTIIHVRRTPVRRACTPYMYDSVNTALLFNEFTIVLQLDFCSFHFSAHKALKENTQFTAQQKCDRFKK